MKFKIGINTFFQVNLLEAQKAINFILKDIREKNNYDRIIDAYSGIGTISLPLASIGKNVIGIEQNEDSYKYSLDNKEINQINSAEFICGDVNAHLYNILMNCVSLYQKEY